MGKFMTNDIHRDGETVEESLGFWQTFVPITVNHLLSIPEGVVIIFLVVHGRIQPHSVAID